jgi:hypothetical protein
VKPLRADNPRRNAVIVLLVGLLLDAVADAAPEGLHWDGPGPAIFAGLAALVAFVRGRSAIALSVFASAALVVGALTNSEPLQRLSTPSEPIGFVFMVLQLLGLLTAVVAGAMALRPLRAPSPTRVKTGGAF